MFPYFIGPEYMIPSTWFVYQNLKKNIGMLVAKFSFLFSRKKYEKKHKKQQFNFLKSGNYTNVSNKLHFRLSRKSHELNWKLWSSDTNIGSSCYVTSCPFWGIPKPSHIVFDLDMPPQRRFYNNPTKTLAGGLVIAGFYKHLLT